MDRQERKKSPWRFAFLAMAIYGALDLLGSAIVWLLYLLSADPYFKVQESVSVGIIGGADGPTAIFVTTPAWTGYIVPMICLVIGIWGFLRLRKCRQK